MRQGIHPEYHHDTVVKCACGNTFTTGSVKPELKVEYALSATHSSQENKKSLMLAEELINSTRDLILINNFFMGKTQIFPIFVYKAYFSNKVCFCK